MRSPQYLKDPIQTLLSHYVTNAHNFGVIGRHPNRQITLLNLEHEIDSLNALDDASLDCFDFGSAMVRINYGLADLKSHRGNPFR
jgi:hypothetical protein